MEEILPTDNLLRRIIFADPNYIKPDGTVCSFAFKPRRGDLDGLSVDIQRLTTYEQAIQNPQKFRLYSVNAQEITNLGLECRHDPLEDNYAHALIKGVTKPLSKKLALLAVRVPA